MTRSLDVRPLTTARSVSPGLVLVVPLLILLGRTSGAVALQEAVDLAIHHPAAVVRVDGGSYLVHELWITAREAGAVTLHEVAVVDGARTLAAYRDADLRARVGRPGLPRTHPTPLLLEPKQSAVVYFWIRLDGAAPSRVQHRVSWTAPGAPRASTIEGGPASVSPLADAEVLDAPLSGEGWAAVYDPLMMGGHRTAIYTVGERARIPGRFAIDWIRLAPTGRAHTDPASRPADWNGFGAEVLAVKDARVAAAVDGRPDADGQGKARETITRENAAGNYVVLDLGRGRFAFYEHLQQGSVRVKEGDRVTAGQPVARVGSSGSVSSGPHLHFHLADGPTPLGAEGLPFVLRQFAMRGAFASIGAFASGEAPVPLPGGVVARSLERPSPNAVIDFSRRR